MKRLGMYSNGGGGPSTFWSFDGDMDEARLSNVARSTNWVWGTWFNSASNDLFQTYGGVESTAFQAHTIVLFL